MKTARPAPTAAAGARPVMAVHPDTSVAASARHAADGPGERSTGPVAAGRAASLTRQRRYGRGLVLVLSAPATAAAWLAPRLPPPPGARYGPAAGCGAANARRQHADAHREAARKRA